MLILSTLFRDRSPMIHSGLPVFHFRSSAVYIAASTLAHMLVHILATAIFFKVQFYITSKWQVEPELILSLKYYQLRVLASNRKWETGLVVMVARTMLSLE